MESHLTLNEVLFFFLFFFVRRRAVGEIVLLVTCQADLFGPVDSKEGRV